MKKIGAKEKWLEKASQDRTNGMKFTSLSGKEVDICYGPEDIKGNYDEKLGFPGEFPYTRGVHSNMYRGKIWTMRQFAGFGTPEDTNQRFKYL